MPYVVARPPAREGHGPMTVYRAIATVKQPLLQQPMMWVRAQPAFRALAANPSAEIAVALAAASVADVEKIWTELAFESARQGVSPTMPSRLDSIFGFADPFEALSFTEITGEAKQVWEGTIQDGVPWAVVDMSAFEVVVPTTPDENGYQEAWNQAVAKGSEYWAPSTSIKVAEVLAAGPVVLTRRIELLPLMREHGLIEAS